MAIRTLRIKWKASQKLKHLVDSYHLKDIELGSYLRQHGLYSSDLKTWKQEAEYAFDGARPMRNEEKKRMEIRIKFLEKELEKANLKLELQKKIQEINQKHDEAAKPTVPDDKKSSNSASDTKEED